ncbi:hypothetical protein BL250_06530 [Erwinia sp. OLTSP20]|uniref:YbdD/YjiX family protein n=1 Tax=unclassified Erwinia TaxID=2622719 RepID=UPI000C59FE51|nr:MULTISPECIES: CstA-like transporter-associated (seleno)protein [unclassified Erwinia]PIJ74379.1 hypothetical protein BK416_04235 [Erwinia sp. OLSSP12]PIJ83788.1 hypothetical protein BLD47_03890 [Erwinia sp. OLCASP19]PIJ86831.1 hypothetical protein BLD46_02385 [Erwinia sp. OLMTSP26]PIJ88238.1 hypothetical protein BLD49_03065 [Erwinia sp. OLMDSP33]PIJ91193.1 hypothetical protein BL249_09735 [Erwinia sp. OLFS4]
MFSAVKVWRRPVAPVRAKKFIPLNLSPATAGGGWRLFLTRLAQSFRLMVVVGDYQAYRRHLQRNHPEKMPMTPRQFHRYCLEKRYPGKAGAAGRCPC